MTKYRIIEALQNYDSAPLEWSAREELFLSSDAAFDAIKSLPKTKTYFEREFDQDIELDFRYGVIAVDDDYGDRMVEWIAELRQSTVLQEAAIRYCGKPLSELSDVEVNDLYIETDFNDYLTINQ